MTELSEMETPDSPTDEDFTRSSTIYPEEYKSLRARVLQTLTEVRNVQRNVAVAVGAYLDRLNSPACTLEQGGWTPTNKTALTQIANRNKIIADCDRRYEALRQVAVSP